MTEENMTERIFEVVELAKASGKISKGTNEVTKAIEKQKAKLVVVAQDVSPAEIVMHLPLLAKEKSVPCVKVSSKTELGTAAGLGIGTSAIAILNEGSAKAQLKALVESLTE